MKKGFGFYVLIFLVTVLFVAVSYFIMVSSESGKIPATLISEVGYGFVIFFALIFWPDKEEEQRGGYIQKARTLIQESGIKLCDMTHERDQLKKYNEQLEIVLKKKDYEIYKLRNPLPPAKFKVGQRAGNLVIRTVAEDNTYTCLDADGKFQGCFREEDIELMMKLNPESK